MNQVRMAFLVAAASDKQVGYDKQLAELLSIAAGAFGWRALARELVGFIPLGGGLIPKGAIAYRGHLCSGQRARTFPRRGLRLHAGPKARRLPGGV
jgi:hypothetical protein